MSTAKRKKKPARKPAKKGTKAKKRSATPDGRPWALDGLRTAWRATAAAAVFAARGAAVAAAGIAAAWNWETGGRRPAVLGLWSGLACTGLALTGVAVAAALPAATGDATLRLAGTPPAWIAPNWADAAIAACRGPLYAPGRVPRVGRALAASPWIADVSAVHRTEQGLVAHCTFRMPRFVVQRGGTPVVLDRDGVRMPPIAKAERAKLSLLRLTGVPGGAPAVGRHWQHPCVRAAVRVGAKLHEVPAVLTRLRSLHCEPVAGYVRVELHTVDGGGAIEWGVAGGGVNEVSEDVKLAHLIELMQKVQNFRTIKRAKVWTRGNLRWKR